MRRRIVSILLLLCVSVLSYAQDMSYDYKKGKKNFRSTVERSDSLFKINYFQQKGKKWKNTGEEVLIPIYASGEVSFPDSLSVLTLGNGKTYFFYSYLDTCPSELSYYSGLYDIMETSYHMLSFSGKALKAAEGEVFRIEGLPSTAFVEPSVEVEYLDSLLKADARIVEISPEDMKTDSYIAWWIENNPKALTNAKTIEFGGVSEDCSIFSAFKKAKKSEKGNLQAAICDVRGYTVVVVRNTKAKSNLLVWAEPECKNKKKDRYLSTVYFENANSLVLYFYKGKTTFKYRINLANRTISR
ncbi:MAG: hypothetical protein ACI4TL_00600 [Candidatus Cryptobacteroides sp.]